MLIFITVPETKEVFDIATGQWIDIEVEQEEEVEFEIIEN